MTQFAFTLLFVVSSFLISANPTRASTESFAAPPEYGAVYPDDRIVDFKIIIAPTDWSAMQDNMRKLYGEPGKPRPRPNPGEAPMPQLPKEKPMWVNASIVFDGKTWPNVAVRYKGNSSLMSSWMSGSHKLPFKIDFSKFESKKRKFYGFTEISLSNNFADDTYLREPFAYRLLADMGMPASHTALYRLKVDYGSGEKDYGLYTAIEVTNDTVVGNFFGEDKGNIYEGDGRGVTLEKSITAEQIKNSFEKENNKKNSDWSDLVGLHDILHSPDRTARPQAWRAELERRFAVNDFLKWLAFAAVLEHWDTYGGMTHNFYLYNKGGQLNWLSWDHNLILGAGFGPMPKAEFPLPKPPGKPHLPSVTFERSEVTDKWPLIRFLLDDPKYNTEYKNHLHTLKDRYFNAAKIETDLRLRAKTIRAALSSKEEADFDKSVDKLVIKIYEREQKLKDYLQNIRQR